MGSNGHALMTTSLPNNTLLTVAFTVGLGSLMNDSIYGGLPPTLAKNLSLNLSFPSDGSLSLNSFGPIESAKNLTTDLSAWEGRGSIVLADNANPSVSIAKTDLASTTQTHLAATNGDTAAAIQAMPDGPLPWWASLGGLGVVFWFAARQRKLPNPLPLGMIR